MEIIKDLPEVFEEFAEQRQKSFLAVKQLKDKGIPVIGSYCTYFPNPDKPEKLFLFSTPCVILKKKGVFICYSLINTLIKFMASLPVMTA